VGFEYRIWFIFKKKKKTYFIFYGDTHISCEIRAQGRGSLLGFDPTTSHYLTKIFTTAPEVEFMQIKAEQCYLCRENQRTRRTLEAIFGGYTQPFSMSSVALDF
jgi:hypothetical protein